MDKRCLVSKLTCCEGNLVVDKQDSDRSRNKGKYHETDVHDKIDH
jgi:hypothetical protein